ncbi:MAG TPA: SulP family inorganic anion transporter [Kaistiaceae bacterium]|nr:SulP family inorganic anion transporter [Kaistiaceae bacterium]
MTTRGTSRGRASGFAEIFTPKFVSAMREGYHLADLRHDAIAGLTVAIVALPLAMAIAVASGTTPERGLFTAIVAGFLISALGGSRFQIGGPTAAFIVVVFDVIEKHGLDGLVLATVMAGLILVAIGLLRLGTYIKYIPYPVVTGFTAGIAVSIFASQIKEVLGLDVALPADFLPKMEQIGANLGTTNFEAVGLAAAALGIILLLRRYRPKWPGFLIAIVATAVLAAGLHLDVATIGSRFGGVPRMLPTPTLPAFDLARIEALLPSALTIALLAGIESLLSAVVADGMTGRRHRSNSELLAQGIANVAAGLFGGISATGAIARTATNIRAGARTPVAGMLHAVFLLLFMLVAAPLLAYVPLATLGAILLIVAWNIGEIDHIRRILAGTSQGDRVVMITTFLLTLLFDLTVAIEVGVVLAAFQFMHRMADAVEVQTQARIIEGDVADTAPRDHAIIDAEARGHDYVIYRINGPFFFGASQRVSGILEQIGTPPRAYILDFSAVPFVDSTAASALKSFVGKARQGGSRIIIANVRPDVRHSVKRLELKPPTVIFAASVEAAIAMAGADAPHR